MSWNDAGAYTVSMEMLASWPLAILILLWLDRRHGRMPLFIVYSYIAGLAINHWFGALVHIVPTDASQAAFHTPEGFALSTWGVVFVVGGAALYPARRFRASEVRAISAPFRSDSARRTTNVLLLMGLLCWIAELSPLMHVPSAGAVVSGGKQLLIATICLKCWLAWTHAEGRKLLLWLAAGFVLPLYTMLILGFLSYGITYLSCILIFVATFYRPRWQVFAAGFLAVYVGLSIYVAYFENRTEIRETVWGGRSMEARINVALKMLSDVTPFNPFDRKEQHLVDLRLNQNVLVGTSMHYVPEFRPYADGETLYTALLALVPRAIWPNKPVIAGSGNLVSEYTGVTFAEGTSVGIGQVMEFYVNFGWLGVAVGFFCVGFGLRAIDLRVSDSILNQQWSLAGLWFAVGLSAIQPIGQLVEVTSSMAAAAVFGAMALRLSKGSGHDRRMRAGRGALRPYGAMPLAPRPEPHGSGRVGRSPRHLS